MGWIESQLQLVTNRVEYLFRWLGDLQNQIRAVQQGLQSAYQQWSPDPGADYFTDNLSLAAATGTWPNITPSSTSATVYSVSGGALVSLGSKTVYNFSSDATDSTKRQILGRNSDATFSVLQQSLAAG